MITVAICATLAILAQAAAIVLIVRMLVASQEQQRTALLEARATSDIAQAEERRQLADRIQQPERVPMVQMPDFMLPEQDDDDLNLVGTIIESDSEDS